jgi:hypothetical protein
MGQNPWIINFRGVFICDDGTECISSVKLECRVCDRVMLVGNGQGEGICSSGDLPFNSQLLSTGQLYRSRSQRVLHWSSPT